MLYSTEGSSYAQSTLKERGVTLHILKNRVSTHIIWNPSPWTICSLSLIYLDYYSLRYLFYSLSYNTGHHFSFYGSNCFSWASESFVQFAPCHLLLLLFFFLSLLLFFLHLFLFLLLLILPLFPLLLVIFAIVAATVFYFLAVWPWVYTLWICVFVGFLICTIALTRVSTEIQMST